MPTRSSPLDVSIGPLPPTASAPVPRNRRSVFGNYRDDGRATPTELDAADLGAATPAPPPAPTPAPAAAPEAALARSFVHQFLARAFDYPCVETWSWLTEPAVHQALAAAVATLDPDSASALRAAAQALAKAVTADAFERLHNDYIAAIGHAARGSCPINEIEYGDLKADPLFQPHRLADLAAFYRAFGLEVGSGSNERHDHLSVELEFMGVLTAQEARLGNAPTAAEALVVCHDAQRQFLREHLGRWTPGFARRLESAVGEGPLGALARFALAFIEGECRRHGVTPGSPDLVLRPADEGALLCEGCGLGKPSPTASPGT